MMIVLLLFLQKQNLTICSHLDMLISSYGAPPSDPVSWNRCKDLLKSSPTYVAAPTVSIYLQHIERFTTQHVATVKLTGQTDRPRGHFMAAFSAEALCWVCGSPNHNPRRCKMRHTTLTGAPPCGAQALTLVLDLLWIQLFSPHGLVAFIARW